MAEFGFAHDEASAREIAISAAMIEMEMGVDDRIDLLRSDSDGRKLADDRLFWGLLRRVIRKNAFDPFAIEAGIDQDFAVAGVDQDRENRESGIRPLVPGSRRRRTYRHSVNRHRADIHAFPW